VPYPADRARSESTGQDTGGLFELGPSPQRLINNRVEFEAHEHNSRRAGVLRLLFHLRNDFPTDLSADVFAKVGETSP
jgi:hypothetical protein